MVYAIQVMLFDLGSHPQGRYVLRYNTDRGLLMEINCYTPKKSKRPKPDPTESVKEINVIA